MQGNSSPPNNPGPGLSAAVAEAHGSAMFKRAIVLSTLALAGLPAILAVPDVPSVRRASLPLVFEENRGQADPRARFVARGPRHTLFLTPRGPDLALRGPDGARATIRMRLAGGRRAARLSPEGALPGRASFFLGSDPDRWRAGVPLFSSVRYEQVYPGIDVLFHGGGDTLEYDFVVAPGVDPALVRLEFRGAEGLSLDGGGNLIIRHAAGQLTQRAPRLYQEVDGQRRKVPGGYRLLGRRSVGFEVGPHDSSLGLVIDPVIESLTAIGGDWVDGPSAIAVDRAGSIYLTSHTYSSDFPTLNPLSANLRGGSDAMVVKLDPSGSRLLFATYLGGGGDEGATGLAVADDGSVWVFGGTNSADFPTVAPLQSSLRGAGDLFLARLSASGSSLSFSTFLGGSQDDIAARLALDPQGNAYLTGWTDSPDFPTVRPLPGDRLGYPDAFVVKVDRSGASLVYSTLFGGAAADLAIAVTADSAGRAYVTGYTNSTNFPSVFAFDNSANGHEDAFVVKLESDGSRFLYSTYLGGFNMDVSYGIAVDAAGAFYVTGFTESFNFPTANALDRRHNGYLDVFVTKFVPDGSALAFSTFLGGSVSEWPNDLALDAAGNVVIVGMGNSPDFPAPDPMPYMQSGHSLFLASLAPDGSAFRYVSRFGGSGGDEHPNVAAGPSGSVYMLWDGISPDLPVTTSLLPETSFPPDLFVARISPLRHLLFVSGPTIAWNAVPPATRYDLVRGDVRSLLASGGDFSVAVRECLADDTPWTFASDPNVPAAGEAFFYASRPSEPAAVATYDSLGSGQVGSRDAEIDASTYGCAPPLLRRGPILISGNAGFTTANGVVGGAGSEADPYVIAGHRIVAPSPDVVPLEVRDTDAWFVVRGVDTEGGAAGVRLRGVRNGRLEGLASTRSLGHGVEVLSSADISIVDSHLHQNPDGAGVRVASSSRVTLARNDIEGNLVGILLDGVHDSTVRANHLVGNVLQALDSGGGGNAWDGGYPAGGNYWSNDVNRDLCGGPSQDVCSGADGIGDAPYLFSDAASDRYPLMALPGAAFDAIPPGLAFLDPPTWSGSLASDSLFRVRGTALDAQSGVRRVELRVNQGAWSPAQGGAAWDGLVPLAPGENTIEARAVDHANNASRQLPVYVLLDAPQAFPWWEVLASQPAYSPGEGVGILARVTNVDPSPLTLTFPSSCHAYFTVENAAGEVVYDLRRHADCEPIESTVTLQPGQTEPMPLFWDQKDDAGRELPRGSYVVRAQFNGSPPLPATSAAIVLQDPAPVIVDTDRMLYAPGQPVSIVVTIRNVGSGTLTLSYASPYCQAYFTVEDAAGSIVYDQTRHRSCLLHPSLTLQPGESKQFAFSWSQITDFGTQVPKGDYVVRSLIPSTPSLPEGQTLISIGP